MCDLCVRHGIPGQPTRDLDLLGATPPPLYAHRDNDGEWVILDYDKLRAWLHAYTRNNPARTRHTLRGK